MTSHQSRCPWCQRTDDDVFTAIDAAKSVLTHARTWPGFSRHEAAITKVLRADQGHADLDLEAFVRWGYEQVVPEEERTI